MGHTPLRGWLESRRLWATTPSGLARIATASQGSRVRQAWAMGHKPPRGWLESRGRWATPPFGVGSNRDGYGPQPLRGWLESRRRPKVAEYGNLGLWATTP